MGNVQDVKQHIDPVTMELDGEDKVLQFDMNAFAELEKRYGSIEKALESLSSGKIGDIRIILWAALLHNHVEEFDDLTGEPIKYSITPYKVGSWITPNKLPEVSEKVSLAMGLDMPDPDNLPEEIKAQLKVRGFDVEGQQTKN